MVCGADRDPELARVVQTNDPSVTRIGRLLRATKLDELPQLWNIIRGDMVFVGPRPIALPLFEELMLEISGFEQRLALKPGLTNLAQVCILENSKPDQVVTDWHLRFEAEKHYMENRCCWYDVIVVSLTVLLVVRKARDYLFHE